MTEICLTVDVEAAWLDHPQEQCNFDVESIITQLRAFEELLTQTEEELEQRIPVTWFVRCDDSVAYATQQKATGLLQRLEKFIERRTSQGDEIGFHPHLYSALPATGNEYEQIVRAGRQWGKFFGAPPKLTRIGEARMNADIAQALVDIGTQIDCSALPGKTYRGTTYSFDWSQSPTKPFFPTIEHPTRETLSPSKRAGYLEVPFAMMDIQADYDARPFRRYMNLAYKPKLFSASLLDNKSPSSAPLVTIAHLHEFFPAPKPHGLISHSPSALRENLRSLYSLEQSRTHTTISQAVSNWTARSNNL